MSHFEEDCRALIEARGAIPEAKRLERCFELVWDNQMREYPEQATGAGYGRYQDQWTDWSDAGIARRKRHPESVLHLLDSFDTEALSEMDQLSVDLLVRQAQLAVEESRYGDVMLQISQMHGVQQEIPRILELMTTSTLEGRTFVLSRLERVPELIDQTVALLSKGLETGVTPPRICLRDLPNQVRALVPSSSPESPVLAFLARRPAGVHETVWSEFGRQSLALFEIKVKPAIKRLEEFLDSTYLPGCTERAGWLHLPDGRDWYCFLVRRETTTTLTPDEIFDIGMEEVLRIRSEMDEVIDETGFIGSFEEFIEFLRTDPGFYYKSASELVTAYRDISKRADPELARLFGTLPRLPYGVVPIPAHAEKSQTTAYYQPGAPSAGRPGYYYVNTFDLRSRPKWEMEALSLHEAVPGHHLQIARMQELYELPEFRRQSWITAYGEGWALYAESLGTAMGFYADPYSRFGQLTYDMWRAIRLVVDPGMHYKGWSREQAIEFFRSHSSKSLHDIGVEIDRYLVWPGQALSYKIGQLRIQAMRARAEARLGDGFDIRQFHDLLLGAGCIPLDVLDNRVDNWIKTQGNR
jgi:uncharacterized protein (DUF885 family)